MATISGDVQMRALTSELFRKQKATVRFVLSLIVATEPILSLSLKSFLPLPSLIEFFKLQFMQRFIQGHLSPSFNKALSFLNPKFQKSAKVFEKSVHFCGVRNV